MHNLSANQAVAVIQEIWGMGDRGVLLRWAKSGLITRQKVHTRCALYDEKEIRKVSQALRKGQHHSALKPATR